MIYGMFGMTKTELATFKKLSTPIKIQNFLDSFPVNYEKGSETYMSPRRVLREKKMHCFEGALVAALALWVHGEKPLLLDLKSPEGDDHVVALYKKNGYWGAISKTNHVVLRFRDPVYRTIRELVLSYFHEYTNYAMTKKTLRSYSAPYDLSKKGDRWVTAEEELFSLVEELDDSRHYPIVPNKNLRLIRPPDAMERKTADLVEWQKSDPRT